MVCPVGFDKRFQSGLSGYYLTVNPGILYNRFGRWLPFAGGVNGI
jgi:hypothetical protein